MSPKILTMCCAAVLAAAAANSQANDVVFSFRGKITQIQFPSTTTFHVGDPFVLYLDFTPGGTTPALGYELISGKRAGSAQGVHNFLTNDGDTTFSSGMGPPYWDNYFANFSDPYGYQMYCRSFVTSSAGSLSFGMFDEDAGPWGSVSVNSKFPSTWLANMANPLPGGVDTINFAASGPLYVNYLNVGGANLTGAISGGSVSRLKTLGNDKPVISSLLASPLSLTSIPEPASLTLLLLASLTFLPRRRHASTNS